MRRFFLIAAASALCSLSAAAQSAPTVSALLGKWNAEWELGRVVENDLVVVGFGMRTLHVDSTASISLHRVGQRTRT